MDDLISREEAINALNRLCLYPGEWAVNGLGLCKDAIANLPSIDAVPVVRCKDCKHKTDCFSEVAMTTKRQTTTLYEPIEWCSKAERRES